MADIFNKFYKDMSKTVKKVKTKSEIFAESVKIKNQIRSIQGEENALFQELGRMLHISIQKNSLDEERMAELKDKSNEIKEKEEQIIKLRQMLSDLELKEVSKMTGRKAIGRCPNCGAIIYEGDKFCGECGFDLLKIEKGKKEEGGGNKIPIGDWIICPNCGYKNPPGSKFCIKCGTPLISNESKDLKQSVESKKEDINTNLNNKNEVEK